MKLILQYIRRHLGMFLTAVLFLGVETFADLLQPTFMAHVVDDGVKGQDISAILRYGAVMLAIAAAGAGGAVMRNLYASRTSQQIGRELRGDMYRKVQTLSFENVDRLQPAAIITRITNDVTQIQNFINGSMRIMMKVPITLIGAVILILVQTPRLFPVIAAIVAVSVVLILANMKLGYPRYGKLQQKLDRLNTVSREFLSSVRVVKAFGAEEEEKEKFTAAASGFAQSGVSASRVLAVFSPLINLVVNFGIVVLLWISRSQPAGQIGRLMASVNYMNQEVSLQGWVRNHRKQKSFGFINFYDGTVLSELQVVYEESLPNFEEIQKFAIGSAVFVRGTMVPSAGKNQQFEMKAAEVWLEGASAEDYPLQPKRHSIEYLREIAHLRPRTKLFQSVFRVRSLAAQAIHDYFQSNNFVYVHTPLITANDGEGAGQTFQVTTVDPDGCSRPVDYTQDFFGKKT